MMKNLLSFLFAFSVVCTAFGQDVFFSESFDNGLPDGWTVDGDWTFGSAADVSSLYFGVPDDGSGFACFNDDNLGQAAVGGGRLISAPIDLTTVTGDVFLTISSYFPNLDYQGSDEQAIVHVSTDMGATWEVLFELVGRGNNLGGEFTDLSSFAGQTIMLTFEYLDGNQWNYGWAIGGLDVADEVTVPSRSYSINAGGAPIMEEAKIGEIYEVSGFIINTGLEPITSYDVVLNDGTNETVETITGENIEYFGYGRYTLETGIEITSASQDYTLSIANVNGASEDDEDLSNNSQSFTLRGIELSENQAVVVEEATGTWCTWCTRGTVYLEEMSKRFGSNFVGIAVHNEDPMAIADYNGAITSFNGFEGFPSVIYNRKEILNPDAIKAPSISDMSKDASLGITVGAQYDDATGAFLSSVEVLFLEDSNADYNVSVVLTEDYITGSGPTTTPGGWNQINAYSGGANGPMGGYEDLPGSVPDYLMVYNHVGKALIGGYAGVPNVVSGLYVAGDVDSYLFDEFQIPADMVTENTHVIGIVTDRATGEIVNAKSVSFADAMATGLSTSVNDFIDNNFVAVYPNIVEDQTTITMRLDGAKNVKAYLVNQMGQRVSTLNYGTQAGSVQLEYDMSGVVSGMYFLQLDVEGQIVTRKLTKVD